MKLGEFIESFVEPNSIVRLVYKHKGGHETVLNTWNDVSMEWEILKRKGQNRHFINNKVIGISCITGMEQHSDAINIVIEKLEKQPFLKEVI
jgi:hypothetical protein